MANRGTASKRYFTEAARAAALETRRRKRELAIPRQTTEVFVVRLSGGSHLFGWEIRRFGAIVIDRGDGAYATTRSARADGQAALARHGVEA